MWHWGRKKYIDDTSVLSKEILSKHIYHILPLSKKKPAFEVSNLPSWKSPDEIVPYDTYIIFEENLGAMLFAKNISKNINTFWSLEA